MPGIDDGEAQIVGGNRIVVTDIPRDQDIRYLGGRRDQPRSRAGDHRHVVHIPIPVSGDPDADGAESIRSHCIDPGEAAFERAVPPDRREAGVRVSTERLDPTEIEEGCERIGGASWSSVEIGVGHDEADTQTDQLVGPGTWGTAGRDAIGGLEEKRVIGDEQVDRIGLHTIDDGIVHLMTDGHFPDFERRITQLKPHRIPIGCRLGPRVGGDGLGDLFDSGHGGAS